MSNSLQPHGLFVPHQAPLSRGFSRQEYWRGLPSPPVGDLPHLEINLCLLCLLHWQVGSLPIEPGKPFREEAWVKERETFTVWHNSGTQTEDFWGVRAEEKIGKGLSPGTSAFTNWRDKEELTRETEGSSQRARRRAWRVWGP